MGEEGNQTNVLHSKYWVNTLKAIFGHVPTSQGAFFLLQRKMHLHGEIHWLQASKTYLNSLGEEKKNPTKP